MPVKHLIILLFVIGVCTSCSRNKEKEVARELHKEYYKNGILKKMFQIRNELYDGFYYEYYENGKKALSYRCEKNLIQGVCTTFYESGTTRALATYENGIKEGKAYDLYEKSGLKASYTYKNNKVTGWLEHYLQNGDIINRYLRDSLGRQIYFIAYNSNGSVASRSVWPIIEVNADTLQLGQEYKVKVSFAYQLKGEVKAYMGFLNDRCDSSINQVEMQKKENIFTYSFKPTQRKDYCLAVFFKPKNAKNDTIIIKENIFERLYVYVK
jgi:hypothetical protein